MGNHRKFHVDFRHLVLAFAFSITSGWILFPNTCCADGGAKVKLSDDDWNLTKDKNSSASGLKEAVLHWHKAWITRNLKDCESAIRPDILRVSQSQAQIEDGKNAVLASLPKEWSAYETDKQGNSAVEFTLRDVHAVVRENTALIRSSVDVTGGTRWGFGDTAAFIQIFKRQDEESAWLLAFEADAWNLSVNSVSGKPGAANFAYDFAIPVKDLARAIKFYEPLLGAPESKTEQVAVFQIKGSRFILDATGAEKKAPIRQGLPNGWNIIIPPDFDQAKESAESRGVTFESDIEELAGWDVLYGYEPGGNLFALGKTHEFDEDEDESKPTLSIDSKITGAKLSESIISAEGAIDKALLSADIDEALEYFHIGAALLEASRSLTHGWAIGHEEITFALSRFYGASNTDEETPSFHAQKLEFSAAQSRQIGPWSVLSRPRTITGAAPWNRKEYALQTLIFDNETSKVSVALSVDAPRYSALALDFDYSGTPIEKEKWRNTIHAIDALTGGATTYKDALWHGFWGERAVLGIFEADPKTDHLPREHEASTYLSLWVSSVEKALSFAKNAGAQLPVIPAINNKAGIDNEPGYRQVYLTDSEGNGLILTEYTSQKKKGSK